MRCPIPGCGKVIGKQSDLPVKRLRAALANHIRGKHPEHWKGNLSRTLNNLKRTAQSKVETPVYDCPTCGGPITIVLTKSGQLTVHGVEK